MKNIIAGLFFLSIMLSVTAQESEQLHTFPIHECGTEVDAKTHANRQSFIKSMREVKSSTRLSQPYSINLVAATYHIIRPTAGAGNGEITEAEVLTTMERVNSLYAAAGIEFYQCANFVYHDDDNLWEFEKNDDDGLLTALDVPNTTNIYFTNNVTSSGSGICGYAYFPGGADHTIMKNSCAVSGTTLEHELGHFFNLYHTHQTFGGVDEIVARPGEGKPTNCATEGDGFCDTDADPSLSGSTMDSDGCIVTSALGLGPNGDPYRGDSIGWNIMSYAPVKSCRTQFTKEQLAMMNWTVVNHSDRNNMVCSSNPVADFTSSAKKTCVNGSVQFIDKSIGQQPLSWSWSFPGGTPNSSTEENPVVTYSSTGSYNVTLTVTDANGNDTEVKNTYIEVINPISLPYTQDFSSGVAALYDFDVDTNIESDVKVAANGGLTNNGLILTGGPVNVYHTKVSPATAFVANPHYNAKATLVCLNAFNHSDLTLDFDMYLLYNFNKTYTYFRVLVNGDQLDSVYYITQEIDEGWQHVSLDLTPFVGGFVDISFETNAKYENTVGTDGNGVFIDNINVDGTSVPQAGDDAGVILIDTPLNGEVFCSVSDVPATSFNVRNFGSNDLNTVTVVYELNGSIDQSFSINPGLSSLQTTIINGSAPNISVPGNYTLKIYTIDPNGNSDGQTTNDTSTISFVVGGASLPISEDFESETLCATTTDCETTNCILSGDWVNHSNGIDDDVDWRVNAGTTVSANTGPSIDHTLGTASGKYVYLETSGTCNNMTARLESPCFSLNGFSNAELRFWYHMFGANMGSLHVDVITQSGTDLDVVVPVSGDQGDQWHEMVVDLSAYLDESVTIIIRGVTGTSFTSDMAIDDISISGTLVAGIQEWEDASLQVFPVPSTSMVTISLEEQIQVDKTFLMNVFGEVVIEEEGLKKKLDLSGLPVGTYILKIVSGSTVLKKKLIKQ